MPRAPRCPSMGTCSSETLAGCGYRLAGELVVVATVVTHSGHSQWASTVAIYSGHRGVALAACGSGAAGWSSRTGRPPRCTKNGQLSCSTPTACCFPNAARPVFRAHDYKTISRPSSSPHPVSFSFSIHLIFQSKDSFLKSKSRLVLFISHLPPKLPLELALHLALSIFTLAATTATPPAASQRPRHPREKLPLANHAISPNRFFFSPLPSNQ